jgi:hypothetical protein
MGCALLWVLIATVAAGLLTVMVLDVALLGRFAPDIGWARAASEALSGAVAGLLLMPGILYAAAGARR